MVVGDTVVVVDPVVVVGDVVVDPVVVVGDAVVVDEEDVVDPVVLFHPSVKTGQVLRSGICWLSQSVKWETSE